MLSTTPSRFTLKAATLLLSRAYQSFVAPCLALGMALAMSQPASAQTLYATSINTGIIYKVDVPTHHVTPYFNTGAALDSLFFDAAGRIIYSQLNAGRVMAYDPNSHSNVALGSGLSSPIDMTLEPNQTSCLVSVASSLRRVSLSGGVIGSVLSLGNRPDGLAYDASNHLFVNVSTGFQVNNSRVKRIDPTTGAVIAQSANTGVFLDGLTYDSATGMLFASDYNNGRLTMLNPATLAITFLTPKGALLSAPDGITSDGLGNLYIASRGNSHVVEYNIASNNATVIATIAGLDDLAPAVGLGAPVPEPGTVALLLGAAVPGVLLLRRRDRSRRRAA